MRKIHLKVGLLLFMAAFFIIGGCSIQEPKAPSWESTWDLPLTNRTYSIEDIVNDMDTQDIVFDSLGNPSFSITQDVDTVAVEDNLTADAVSQTYEDSLEAIDIDPPTLDPEYFNLTGLDVPNDGNNVISDTTFDAYRPMNSDSTFDWAVVNQGTVNIQVFNDLGIDLDSLVVWIYNTSDLVTPICIAIFENGIADNQTLSRQASLDGKYIENELTLRITGEALAQPITLPSNDLVITATFPGNLSVSSAFAEIPALSRDLNQTIDLTDGSIIYDAVIDQATLTIQIVNGSNLPMNLDMTLPNFELNSTTLTITEFVAGNSTVTRNINLSGYTIIPDGTSAPQTIAVNVLGSVDDTSPVKYRIDAGDSLDVIADVSNVIFESVNGQIEPTEIAIDPMNEQVDMPEGFENASLTHAEMRIRLYNNCNSDIFVDLLLENQDGSENLVVQDTVRGKSEISSVPRETEIIVTAFALSSFLDPAPRVINITGTAILNPANADSVRIHKDDFFYGEAEIYSPLAFALADTSTIDLDISDAEVSGNDSPDFNETFNYGVVQAELTSHIPVGLQISLYIGTVNTDAIYTDANSVVIGPFTLQSAPKDADGYATQEIASAFEDSLTSDEIAIFDNDIVYIAPRVSLLPTSGSYITGADYFEIRANAIIEVNTGEHLWKDDNNN